MSESRICNEIAKLKIDPPVGISVSFNDNIYDWDAIIFGPDESPWEGGIFQLKIKLSNDYPHKSPNVKFITQMFHPNIYRNGNICLDILQSKWSPIYDIRTILLSIQSLLTDPNVDSPANIEAAKLYSSDRKAYNKKVRSYVEKI